MGLIVRVGELYDRAKTTKIAEARWAVELDHLPGTAVAHGFVREKDAQIAKSELEKLAVDWEGSLDDIEVQLGCLGDGEWLNRVACEYLQW